MLPRLEFGQDKAIIRSDLEEFVGQVSVVLSRPYLRES